jgi:hypothetical protein
VHRAEVQVDFMLYKGGADAFRAMFRIVQLMHRILDILGRGDDAVQFSFEVDRRLEELHVLVREHFDPSICKPKCHFSYHIGRGLRKFQLNLNCFSNERRAKVLKQAATMYKHASQNEHWAMHQLTHETLYFFSDQDALRKFVPCNGRLCPDLLPHLSQACEHDVSRAVVCKSLKWKKGLIRAGQFVGSEAVGKCLFKIIFCAVASDSIGGDSAFIVGRKYIEKAGSSTIYVEARDSPDHLLALNDSVITELTCVSTSEGLFVAFPNA